MIHFNRFQLVNAKFVKSNLLINTRNVKHFFSSQNNSFQKELGLKNKKTLLGRVRRFQRIYPNLNWYLRYFFIFGVLTFFALSLTPGSIIPGQYKLKLTTFKMYLFKKLRKKSIFKYWATELQEEPQNYINQIFEDITRLFKQQIFDLNYICQCFQAVQFYSEEADEKRQQRKKLQIQHQKMIKQGKSNKTSIINIGQQQKQGSDNFFLRKNKQFHEAKINRQNQQKKNLESYETALKKCQHFFDKITFRSVILMYSAIILEKIIKYEVDLLLQPRLYQKYWFVFSKVFSLPQIYQKSDDKDKNKNNNDLVFFMEIQTFNQSCYPVIDYLIKYRNNMKNEKEILTKILQKVASQMKINEQFCKKSFDNQNFIKTLKIEYQSKQNDKSTKQLILSIFQEMDKVYNKIKEKKITPKKISKVNQKSLEIQFKRISQFSQKRK